MHPPIHPGEVLADELAELNITPTELARQIAVPAMVDFKTRPDFRVSRLLSMRKYSAESPSYFSRYKRIGNVTFGWIGTSVFA